MSNTIDTPHLVTRESPFQILSEDYPKHDWPISGGWGYDESSPCVIELDTECKGVPFEREFILYRAYEELIVFRPRGEGYAGITVKLDLQSLLNINGRNYDKVDYTISAWKESDWEMLKEDWENHNGYKGDAEGAMKHLMIRLSKKVSYKTTGFFDITRFFGKAGNPNELNLFNQ